MRRPTTGPRVLPATIRAVVLAVVLSVLAAAVGACSSSEDQPGGDGDTEGGFATRTVSTDQGEVEVPADPQRVVLLNYALAGYLYDLDVPVTHVTPEAADTAGEFSPFWAEQAEAAGTELMPWSSDGFDLEAIFAADPDLIVAGGIGFPLFLAEDAYDDLSDIAPTVIVSGDRATWQEQYDFLATDVFDRPEVYEDAVSTYETRTSEVRDAITVPEGESVFLSITSDGAPYVLIEDQGLPTVFAELGFRPAPVFATGRFEPYTEGGDSFELSPELVGDVLDQQTLFVVGFNGAPVDVESLAEDPIYAALPSFRADQAYDLPYYVYRGDYAETLALLDVVEEQFAS